jgi:hypothetical protein
MKKEQTNLKPEIMFLKTYFNQYFNVDLERDELVWLKEGMERSLNELMIARIAVIEAPITFRKHE